MPIQISGFRELARELGRVSPDLKKELRQVNLSIAKAVAPKVQSAYSRRYQQRTGKTRSTIRALATQRGASVAFGKARTPWIGGQEFGSNQGARKKQFPRWNKDGYFLFPTVRDAADEHFDETVEAFDKFIKRAFPERGAF